MIAVTTCSVCNEMNGYFTTAAKPNQATTAYCRCQPEGWEVCTRHEGNVRRRHQTVRIINEAGEYRYFSAYAMMAPCREDTCFTPEKAFYEKVRLNAKKEG